MIAVLLVDDHEAFLAFVKHGLIRQGYTPVTAASGAAALELLATMPIDVAVTDIMMPDMDGIELLREIRKRHPELPVIAMTGASSDLRQSIGVLMKTLGAAAVLEKPFSTSALIDAIEACRPDLKTADGAS
jgi:CheY-like chemotaxis protein